MRPNIPGDLRRTDPRRLAAGTVTTGDLRAAPNDEVAPNGYPPPRVYPMPQPVGTLNAANFTDAPVVEREVDDETMREFATTYGADDKSFRVSSANVARDQQGAAPTLIDGQGTVDDPGPAVGEADEAPEGIATPPLTRKRRSPPTPQTPPDPTV
jgi:hypothetical protein